jgi:hypothetical protein
VRVKHIILGERYYTVRSSYCSGRLREERTDGVVAALDERHPTGRPHAVFDSGEVVPTQGLFRVNAPLEEIWIQIDTNSVPSRRARYFELRWRMVHRGLREALLIVKDIEEAEAWSVLLSPFAQVRVGWYHQRWWYHRRQATPQKDGSFSPAMREAITNSINFVPRVAPKQRGREAEGRAHEVT